MRVTDNQVMTAKVLYEGFIIIQTSFRLGKAACRGQISQLGEVEAGQMKVRKGYSTARTWAEAYK